MAGVYDDQDPFGRRADDGSKYDAAGRLKQSEDKAAQPNAAASDALGGDRSADAGNAFNQNGDDESSAQAAFGGNGGSAAGSAKRAFGSRRDSGNGTSSGRGSSDSADKAFGSSQRGNGSGSTTGRDSFGRSGGSEENVAAGAFGRARNRMREFRGKASGRLKKLAKNKWFMGIGIGGGGGLALLIILLVILLGSLKIPDLAQHILEYQFNRVARNYSEHAAIISAEDTALSTADRNALQRSYDKFSKVKDKTWGSMWDKINHYRPDEIVAKMKTNGTLDYKYQRGNYTSLWSKKLTAIVINGQEIPYNKPNLWNKIVHPIDTRSDRIQFSNNVNDAIAQAQQGRSAIIRGAVAKSIRDDLHVPLKWWRQLDKYSGKDQAQAEAVQEGEAVQQINEGDVAPSKVGAINDAEQKAQQELQKCVADPACDDKLVASGGKLPGPVLSAISDAVQGDVFQKGVGAVSLSYSVGLPVCIIYDGSIQNTDTGKTIDNTSAEDQRSFYAIETAADQQKYGDTNGEAVGAMNWKAGDTSMSIPSQRASGLVSDTSAETSPQAAGIGAQGNANLSNTTTIFSFLPSPFDGLANDLAGTACPVVSNVWFGAGTALIGLVADFFSGGTSVVAQEGLTKALSLYIRDTVAQAFSKKELAKLGIITAGTTALSLYAEQLVAHKAALNDSGVAVGPAFDNAADKGGNLNANETSRRFFARPLTNGELAQTNIQDRVYSALQTSKQSSYQRYFAISNANSLLSRVGVGISAHLNSSIFSSLSGLAAKIFNPLGALTHLFSSLNPQVALAASGGDTQNYGIVQWGWSNDEENLIKSDASYQPIENQAIIEAATYDGKPAMDGIAAIFNKCWGYDASGNPDPTATMGLLLTEQDIRRGVNGNVDAKNGLCAPDVLSYNSLDNKAYDPTNGRNDLIFRYRLEKNYEKTIDQGEAIANAQITQT